MAVRLAALLPRLVAVTVIWLLATATLTFAAEKRLSAKHPSKPVAPVTRPELVVPDVRNQAFVFAKGLLDDAGFAWRVTGSVKGYAANVVASQIPAPGVHVIDTGAPTITLHLARGRYGQDGVPEDASAYHGTATVLASAGPRATAPAKPSKRVRKPVRHAVKRAARHVIAKPRKKPAATVAVRRAHHQRRPDFVVPGAPREPQDEISLPARAERLSAWLTSSRQPTNANVRHWLYQHAWIVTGAKFGWWHGAQALRTLIAVDRRVQSQWGFGGRSEAVARATLARVEARGR